MLNCDQIFEKLKLWAARQPKSFVDVRPTPTPEDTMAEDVIDGYYVLQEFDFPQQSFVQGGREYGFAQTDDNAYFWIAVNEAFDALMTPWYQRGICIQDTSLVEEMEYQASEDSFLSSSPLSPQQFRVIRQNSTRPHYGDPNSWEPSLPFRVLVRITSCRTMVPIRGGEAYFGWKTEAVALYRESVGLSILEPRTKTIHFFDKEPAKTPNFLALDE